MKLVGIMKIKPIVLLIDLFKLTILINISIMLYIKQNGQILCNQDYK